MTSIKKHPEWNKENSLTSPDDRDRENRWRPEQGAPQLDENEVKSAMVELNNTSFVDKFPRIDRTYQDPQVQMQNIGLLSFVPAKGAKPNNNGVYGFAKLRGNYSTPMEADQRAEYLIRNADSYHQIYHTYVGRPFPITSSSKYSAETNEIDIRREATKSISSCVKDKKDEEQKIIKEMKEKEDNLLDESKKAKDDDGVQEIVIDPYENYITLNVKKAQLTWTFKEHLSKMSEVRELIIKTRKEIKELDEEHIDFKDKYFDKYMQARKDAGLDQKREESEDNFMKFMVEETIIPTIDTDDILPSF
jgi:hypothetical protein|tara:strand:- start:6820 stop:7734 length:915 start_codon:yes stop_codon:yes gene_type:complete